MNFFNRLQGIFFNPQQTMKAIADRPAWVDTLIVILIAVALFTYLIMPYTNLDQAKFYENSPNLRERMGEERYTQTIEDLKTPSTTRTIIGTVQAPVMLFIGFLISSFFLLIFSRMFSTEGKYKQVLAVNVSANLIDKVLGNAVRLPLILSKQSAAAISPSLALLFPKLEVMSTPYLILSQFDFFQLWMFAVMAFGLAAVFKIEYKKALFVSYLIWFLKSVLYIAVILISMSFVR